jgi:predicted secreted hydrolase
MSKEPIMIEPAEEDATMNPASRIRFGMTYPIEWNVKVKNIGMVSREHISKLVKYWREEYDKDTDDLE